MPSGPCQASSTTSQLLRSRKALTEPIAFSFMSFMSRSLDSEARQQGRKRSRAWKQMYPDGSFSRCSRAQRMGRRTRKSVAALAGRPPACDLARPRSAGAGIRIKGAQACGMESGVGAETLRAWDAARRRLQGCSRELAATSRQRMIARPRVPTPRSAPPAADMRTGSLAARWLSMRNGYGAARHVRRKKEDSR